MKRLVIFDLDGTLLNTINDLGTAANYALKTMGFPTHHISSYSHFVGGGITNLLKRVIPATELNEKNINALRELFVQFYNEHLCDTTLPYAGIPETLDAIVGLGIDVAVASNKYQEATVALIKHFFGNIPWVAVEGQKPGYPVKPDPSLVFEILSENPTPKADVVYVGDSAVDIETARRAAIDSISVSWGFRPVSELVQANASVIINSPKEILEIINKQSS